MLSDKFLNKAILLIAVFFAPVSFLFFYQNAFFEVLTYIDPFIYVGYGHNYTDQSFLDGYYKISRLPWVLTQFLSRSILNADLVSYVLHFGIYSSASYLMFRIAEKIAGILPAFMVTILTPLFLCVYSGGADYHNNFSAVLFLALILYVLNGAINKKDCCDSFFLKAGILYALVVHTNVLLSLDALVYSSCVYTAIKVKRSEPVFTSLTKKILLTISGFLLCTLALCIVNYSVGRHFLFMKPLWSFMIGSNPGNNVSYWKPMMDFIWSEKDLSHFFALFPCSLLLVFYLLRKKLCRDNAVAIFLNIAFIFTFLEIITTQALGIYNLYIYYFSFTAIVPFLITLSVNLGLIFDSEKLNIGSRQIFAIAVASAILLLALLLNSPSIYAHNFFFPNSSFLELLSVWFLFFIAAFHLRKRIVYRGKGKILIAVFIAIFFFIAAFELNGLVSYNKNSNFCNKGKSISDAYVEFNNHVKKYKLDHVRNSSGGIFIWWNKDQNISYNQCNQNITKNCSDNLYKWSGINCASAIDPLTNAAISIASANSGSVNSLDNPFSKGGINKIDDLWKTPDSNPWFKENFLNYNKPKTLVLISYDDKDVRKMIQKMKSHDINFILSEKRKILTDAFMLQYYILTEDGA